MNLSVLVHTFDGYKHLWPGSARSIAAWMEDIPIYWGTDIDPGEADYLGNLILSGPGEWSDRLQKLLKQIPTDYVLYMQEDHWPAAPPPDLDMLMDIVQKKDLFRLQISPIVHFYKLIPAGEIHYFDPYSKYLVSHQPSIWKKSFLLDCLRPGETPWVNEYKGTQRLQQTSHIRAAITKKIAIYPYDWFHHACIKGRVVGMQ